jgi:hypothetical protein
MTYTKRILVLANSWKKGGACIAGRTFSDKEYLDWIRPVSARDTQELNGDERRCSDGVEVSVLDIVDVPLAAPIPHLHQVENHVVDSSLRWTRVQQGGWRHVDGWQQSPPTLWSNGENSKIGVNDKVTPEKLSTLGASLYLIKPNNLAIQVQDEGYEMTQLKARAHFEYNDERYVLKVTDPIAHEHFVQKGTGTHQVQSAVLCVSLTEAFDGYGGRYAYKLVAGVFTPTRSGPRFA